MQLPVQQARPPLGYQLPQLPSVLATQHHDCQRLQQLPSLPAPPVLPQPPAPQRQQVQCRLARKEVDASRAAAVVSQRVAETALVGEGTDADDVGEGGHVDVANCWEEWWQ